MAIDQLDTTGDSRIALALSGGGVRAVAYHTGVLRWLAKKKVLDRVVHVSSVSGGSLLVGLVFQLSGCQWPSSEYYLSTVAPGIRRLLTTRSLQFDMFLRLMNPLNWRYVLSRANILAKSIRSVWNVSGTLGQYAETPAWSINGTTAENGRRFRFKAGTMGDYEIGYARADGFETAAAMAMWFLPRTKGTAKAGAVASKPWAAVATASVATGSFPAKSTPGAIGPKV